MPANFGKLISIVIPCFNEEEVLAETIKRLEQLSTTLFQTFGLETELIFVNDGSEDQTLPILLTFAKENKSVRIINFARNFGHQIAVTAGMDAANGEAVVLMDADLQDPPPVVIEMVRKWLKEEFDVVYATRLERPGESAFKKVTAKSFYRILNLLSDTPIPLDTGDFRLMSKRVVDTMRSMPERERFIRGMVSWVGFKQISLPYKRAERYAGESKYPLRKMLSLAVTGIMSFSIKPLKMASWLGFISSMAAFLGIIYAIFLKLFTSNWITGWTSLMLAILFFGGAQLVFIGILGEYLGRVFMTTKERPLYIVESYYGYDKTKPNLSRSPIVTFK